MEKKDQRITIRLSRTEMAVLDARVIEAGYKSAGVFIRDFIVNKRPKNKVSSNVVMVARELMAVSALVNADAPKEQVLEKLRLAAQANTGGAV